MSRTSRRPLIAAALAALVLAFVPTRAGATAQHAAGLVIDTGERVVTVYVEFPEGEETITGEELLVLADVDAEFADYGSMGKAVCSILGVGSPKEDCFREAERNGLYWNYSRARDGGWERSNRGVSQTTVEHGDVDGWAWGEQGSEPPYHSFEEIRAEHASEPEPSPSPSPSPPTPTPTPSPTRTGEAPAPADTEAAADTTGPTEPGTPRADTDPGTSDAGTAPGPGDPSGTTAPAERTEPTAGGTRTVASPRPTVPPRPTSTPLAATGDLATAERDPLPLVAFVLVLGGLLGTIAWRRRVRSDDDGDPQRP